MSSKKRLLLVGSSGHIGSHLKASLQSDYDLVCPSHKQFDITQAFEPERVAGFDCVINCSGFKDVNGAEKNQTQVYVVNAEGPEALAKACDMYGVPLVHFSTDYVYDGKAARPYDESDAYSPINVYGHSKSLGEVAVSKFLEKHLMIRTCWLYSWHGKNMLTLVKNAHNQQRSLQIVDDQIGSPTPTPLLAQAVKQVLNDLDDSFPWGTYHLCTQGETSWYDLALKFKEKLGSPISIEPISTQDFIKQNPGQALRPLYTPLNTGLFQKTFHVSLPSWEKGLDDFLSSNY